MPELEQQKVWNDKLQKELLSSNEYLERMLLALDEVTGLEGEDREYKKSKLSVISDLCSRLDALKNQHSPT